MNDPNSLSQSLPLRVYKMELEISHRVRSKVQKESILQRKERGSRRNTENTLRLEEDQDCGSGSVSGSRAYADRDTAKGFSLRFYGIFKGKEQLDDLRKISGTEI